MIFCFPTCFFKLNRLNILMAAANCIRATCKVINNWKRWIDEITYFIFGKKNNSCYQIQANVKKNLL